MSQLFKNNAKSRLAADLGSGGGLVFTVTSGDGALFPVITGNDFFLVTLENATGVKEIVKVVSRAGDNFTIAATNGRGLDGTVAMGFNAQDLVELRLTAGFIDSIKEGSLVFVIDGGGAAITAGVKGFIEAPFNGSIKIVKLFADVVGAIDIDIYKDTYADYDPNQSPTDSICANSTNTAKILIGASAAKAICDLTGWLLEFSKGDIFYFAVNSATTITKCTVSMMVDRY